MGIPVLANGVTHSAVDIIVNIMGVPVYGITGLSYKEMQEKEDFFGLGNRPVGRGYGPVKAEGNITLLSEEVEALQKAAPNGNILEIPAFDIVVVGIPKNGTNTFTATLKNCEFKENSRDFKSEDMKIEVELPLIISHIIWS